MKFNVTGLSDTCQSLQQGKMYAFSVADSNWHPLILSHIDTKKLIFLTYKNFDSIGDALPTSKNFDIYHISFDSSKDVKIKVAPLCNELTHLKINNSVVAIDFTESLFLTGTTEQAQQHLQLLQQWCVKSKSTLIFLFAAKKHNTQVDEFLRYNRQQFNGIVNIGGTLSPQNWYIEHWSTPEYLMVRQSFLLHLDNQLLSASISKEDSISTPSQYQFKDSIVLLDEHVYAFNEKINAKWLVCSSQETLLIKAQQSPNATVIVHVFSYTNIKVLAEQIHTLRRTCGDTLKIIIRQVELQLRLTEQNLLRHLGANVIIPAELTIVTLNNIIDSIKYTNFVHEITTDFENSFNKSNIPTVNGYVTSNVFLQFSGELIETANLYTINFALVQLVTVSGLSTIDTVKYCQCLRNGDFFTIIGSSVYFFLYGCREDNISSTLETILGVRCNILFKAQENYVAYEAANIELTKVEQILSNKKQVDYSDQFIAVSVKSDDSELKQAPQEHITILAKPITLQFRE